MFHQTKSQQKQIRFGFWGNDHQWLGRKGEKNISSPIKKASFFWLVEPRPNWRTHVKNTKRFYVMNPTAEALDFMWQPEVHGAGVVGTPNLLTFTKKVWGWYTYHTVCDIRIYIYIIIFLLCLSFSLTKTIIQALLCARGSQKVSKTIRICILYYLALSGPVFEFTPLKINMEAYGTWTFPVWKGKSSSKPSFLGSKC